MSELLIDFWTVFDKNGEIPVVVFPPMQQVWDTV